MLFRTQFPLFRPQQTLSSSQLRLLCSLSIGYCVFVSQKLEQDAFVALLEFHNSPISGMWKSPAVLFMSRKLRTSLQCKCYFGTEHQTNQMSDGEAVEIMPAAPELIVLDLLSGDVQAALKCLVFTRSQKSTFNKNIEWHNLYLIPSLWKREIKQVGRWSCVGKTSKWQL